MRSETDLQTFAARAFASEGVEGFRDDTLSFFQSRFGGCAACLFLQKEAGAPDDRQLACHDLSSDTETLYRSRFAAIDPIADGLRRHARARPQPWALKADDVLPAYDRFLASEFYTEFMRPREVHHVMSVQLAVPGQALGRLSIYRPARAANFSADELGRARLLAPYVSLALERARQAERATLQESLIRDVLIRSAERAIVVLDAGLGVSHRCDAAEEIFEALTPGSGRRRALPEALAARLGRIVASPGFARRGREADQLVLPDGRAVKIELTRASTPTDRAAYFLDLRPEAPLGVAAQAGAGLSRREREVVELVACGLRSAEIAERLCLSLHTVNNHLRAIYAKLGVKSRTEMLHRLSAH